ncbi:MAG: ketoacyl-ACP synthase III [Bacteroidia bacterium]|nr:ketoacyl-ACP synthase III [Bacteroidia bacterium]
MPYAHITGTGFYLPPKVVTNDDMSKIYDTSDEWIVERSGIKERRFIEGELGPSDLAIPAVEMALEEAGITKEDVDLLVFATLSPECWFPGSGCFLQAKMGFPNIGAIDIRQQCTGFVYGLSIAEQYIKNGVFQHIVVVGAEVQSTTIDTSPEGRTVGVLFGDGAGAVVVSAKDTPGGILSTHLHAQGKYAKELCVPEPTSTRNPKVSPGGKGLHAYMNGREVFRHAATRFPEVIREAMEKHHWSNDDIDLIVPHQANLRISQKVAEIMNIPMEKFFSNIHKYGNTTAASIPICIAEAKREGKIKPGDKIILASFGSGFTWASAAIQW